MSHLSLAFLGAPHVHHAGRMLTFRTRKALGLLVYLTVAGGMYSREKLTALFWPESDQEQGRASLRNTLLYLRNALSETSDSPHLITERDALGFDFSSAFELDVHTLQTAFKLARTHAPVEGLEARMRRPLLSQFQAAIEQYRGDFLDGFSLDDAPDFDDWMRLQRETWHRCMSSVFERLSQVQFDGGELADAIETTLRWVAHDPLNEAGYLRLMQVHFALGDRNAALHAYETCRSMLAKELHLQPAPETKALAERLRAKVPPRRAPVPTTPTLQTMPVPAMLPSVPLIGRVTEYGRLIDAFRAAKLGQAQVVILTGEAGIGKTRLAIEFLGWAAAHGADVLQGRAFETGGQVPYQALVEALRSRVEQENAPEDLLSDTWLAELARMLPEVRDRYPDLPSPPLDEATARIRLFESVVRLLQALAEREPLVLFLIALNRIQSGRPQAGITAAQLAQQISLEIENAWGQVYSALPLAYGWLEIGAYSEALACAELAVNLARKASLSILLGLSLILLGAVQRARLSFDAARTAHLEARAMVTPAGVPSSTEAVAAELCADCAMAGAWEEAHAHALQALAARTDTFVHLTKLTLWCQTEAFVRAGEIERATADVRRFGACIGTSRRYRIPYLRALAVLAKVQGKIEQPTQYLQEAARLAEEIGLPGELWSIHAARGETYRAQGDQEQAHGAFTQAASIVRQLADALGNEEQRAHFLASPEVRQVLEA